MKAQILFPLLLILSLHCSSQCLTPLSPPACTGSEPLASENEILNDGVTKWYYGPSATLNTYTLNGGTLVVCGDLTVDRFYMDSGTIFVQPGARFVIGSGIGAGLVLRGKSSIYNYGTLEIQRNLSLEGGYATAAKPNIVINATASSIFRMPNQYFVINNAYSWFVNNGTAEFWGVITDPLASTGSVCLGNGSSTRMAVLINKILDSYSVPSGTACINVHQFSQFYNRLTNNNGLLVCLGAGHTSDAGCVPFGCQPNNWGAAQVFNNCGSCGALITLSAKFNSLTTATTSLGNKLEWQMGGTVQDGTFSILRSTDGINFTVIEKLTIRQANSQLFTSIDKNPMRGTNYYMINYTNPEGFTSKSRIAKLFSAGNTGITIFPVPFTDKLSVSFSAGSKPEQVLLTDITGRNVRTRHNIKESEQEVDIYVLDKIEPGVYIIHVRTSTSYTAQTIVKN